MSETRFFTQITQVDTVVAKNDLGSIQKYNGSYYKYVYNAGSASISPGCGVYKSDAATAGYVTISGVKKHLRNLPAGIGQVTIAAGSYGWILVSGYPASSVYTHLAASFVTGSAPVTGYLMIGASSATGTLTGKAVGAFQSFAPFGRFMSGSVFVNCPKDL